VSQGVYPKFLRYKTIINLQNDEKSPKL